MNSPNLMARRGVEFSRLWEGALLMPQGCWAGEAEAAPGRGWPLIRFWLFPWAGLRGLARFRVG